MESGSFAYLIDAYSIESGYNPAGATITAELPLAFVRSGDVDLYSGKLNDAGEISYNWSRTVRSDEYAYNMISSEIDGVNPPGYYSGHYFGYALLCL